jgi:alpha-tubulin suppressor-like RCC1 family protein
MKRHTTRLLGVFGLITALGWILTDRQPRIETAAVHKAASVFSPTVTSPQSTQALVPELPQVTEVQANAFDALITAGKLERREARMFEAQTWEPDLRKSLDFGPNVPLRRVSEVYEVAEFPYHRVRVDRVYRSDRQAQVAEVPEKDKEAGSIMERSRVPLPTAPPGELLWETAMVADHVMVQTETGITRERLQRALPARTRIRDQITQNGLYLVEVPAEGERSLERAVLALGQLKEVVKFAEPDFLMSGADTTPNDPLYAGAPGPQWHLPKIMAPRAWDVIKEPKTPADAETTVVAVVDTGVDYTHPDLAPNMWTNPNEIAGNGQDDDANGKIDDVSGWDFIGQSTVKTAIIQDNNPMDDSGHGTHVAGVIGAVGNNGLGVSGVCWGVKILPLRIIKKVGTGTYGTYSTALGALDYIKTLNRNGRVVAVANHSWGGSGYSLAMLNSINNPVAAPDPLPAGITSTFLKDVNQITVGGSGTEQAKIKIGMTITGTGIPAGTLVTIVSGSTVTLSRYTTAARTNQALAFKSPVRPKPYGVVHVAAAGNSRFNNDRLPTYPASIPSGFVISVGASDENDNVAIWSGAAGSNHGRLTVDLFAPGSNIWSTKLKLATDSGYGYESRNGTSMAAPQVAGALALLRMWQPNLTDLQARQIVIDQVEVLPTLSEKCLSSGRLHLAKIVDKLYQPQLVASGASTSGSGTTSQLLTSAQAAVGRLAGSSSGTNTEHILVVSEGKVWAWGNNRFGQLGNGTTTDSSVPIQVLGLDNVVMVAVGLQSSFALKADGTVWSWGDNAGGRLGLGTTDRLPEHYLAQQVPGLADITWISAAVHILAVRADGKVFAWGINTYGNLGDGTTTARSSPIEVPGLENIIQADAGGGAHSLALSSDGMVFAWGDRDSTNQGNKLGDGSTTGIATTPIQVPGLDGVIQVETTNASSLFLRSDGTVWSCGGTTSRNASSSVPLQKTGLSNTQYLSGGAFHQMAIDSDGRVFAWGDGTQGQLGGGVLLSTAVPTEVLMDENVSVATCGCIGNVSLILDSEGRLLTSGSNASGVLGVSVMPYRLFPVENPRLNGALEIGASGALRWARRADGETVMWGEVNIPAFTDAPISTFQVPTVYPPSPTSSPMVDIVQPGESAAVALLQDGTLVSWGANVLGILGDGTQTPRSNLLPIPAVAGAAQLSAGSYFTLCRLQNGTVLSWGKNHLGQLGDGTTTQHNSPVVVAGLTSVAQVVAGDAHCLALMADGTVMAWGTNTFGQLGDGTRINSLIAQIVPGLTNIIQVETSAANYKTGNSDPGKASFALGSDGTLYGWGSVGGYFGIGNQSGVDRPSPTIIFPAQANRIVKIVGRSNSIVALLLDGTLLSWGRDGDLLGRAPGDLTSHLTPAPVFGGTNVVQLVGGRAFNGSTGFDLGNIMFRKADGSVWCWGPDGGTMGLGESYSAIPVLVTGFGGASTTVASLGAGDSADSWFFDNFSVSEFLDAQVISDAADPDGDGIENLLEYALGLDPREKDISGLPTTRTDLLASEAQSESLNSQVELFSAPTVDLTSGKRYLAYTVDRSDGIRQDIDYIVEVSNDLETWNSGDPHTVKVLDTAEVLEVYSATSLDDAPRQFMRLRIQRK